ncbi:stealth family protein [Streptomyces sp. NPDC101178]|uniref:stealth family protein n=1 Tax=Streptomyces sp. NPDC101178 TaxID=3366124 RepID=UPI003818BFA7
MSLIRRRASRVWRVGTRAARKVERGAAAPIWRLRVSRRRAALRRVRPDVVPVSVGGLRVLGAPAKSYVSTEAAAQSLKLVSDVLEAAGIPYFLVPGRDWLRHVVGVERMHRAAFLEAATRELSVTPVYLGAVDQGDSLSVAGHCADGRLPQTVREAEVLRMGVVHLGPQGQVLGGFADGCDIEFWQQGEEADGSAGDDGRLWFSVPGSELTDTFPESLVAPRLNRISEVIPSEAQKPATATVSGLQIPTFQPFAQRTVEEVSFAVDAVYTWVDGNEPELAAKREAYREGPSAIAGREVGMSRYTDSDELRYSLRSLEMHASFIRHVYLVTDGQTPSWLDVNAPGLTVVDHRDILPASALPVFNSHAIETCLYRIDGLSEDYLYLNDDVFFGRPVRAEHFFHGNGIARIPFSPYKLGLGLPHSTEPAPNSAGKNVRRVIQKHHDRYITNKFLHTPHPQSRAVMREIAEAGFPELERTTHSRFRSTADVAVAATFHHHWAILTGRAVPGDYSFRYVDVGRPDLHERLARLRKHNDVDFFCLNDVDTAVAARDSIRRAVDGFLEWKFPFPSRFERS